MKFNLKTFIILLIAAAAVIVGLIIYDRRTSPTPAPTPTPTAPTPSPTPAAYDYRPATAASNIKDISIKPGDAIGSPVTVTGSARTWYFEASFPMMVYDANGTLLGQGPVQAQGDWMTEGFVPFKGTLTFTKPTTATGTLVLKNDNPSGDAVRDQEVRIPVRFSGVSVDTVAGGCHPTGCSGQICSDEDAITTCEFLPEYGCYKTATCARQADGACGWTPTPELTACIAKAKK